MLKYLIVILINICCTISLYAGGHIETKPKKEIIRDTIVVHGMVLHGKVVDLGSDRLSFKLNYAEGVNHIKYEDIDTIHTNTTTISLSRGSI